MSETILDRYQAYRIRRYLENETKYAHYLPSWRTRSRRRLLVGILTCSFVVLVTTSVFIPLGPEWAPLLWLPGALVMGVVWTCMQIVSGRRSDAPADALDEWDLERRNAARSIGFSVTQGAVTVPTLALIWATSYTEDTRLALGGGFIILSGLLIGICTPGIILAWTNPEPEPDDIPLSQQNPTQEGHP